MLNYYVRQFVKIRVVFHTLYIWNEDGDPQFFCISGTSNSLFDCSKNFKKIYCETSLNMHGSISHCQQELEGNSMSPEGTFLTLQYEEPNDLPNATDGV